MTLADLSAFLFPYRTHLQIQLRDQRTEFEKRLAEKDSEIRRLRAELGKAGVRMEAPAERPRVAWTAPVPEGPEDWQGELSKLLQEEADGIRSGGRVQEHEPSADDGA